MTPELQFWMNWIVNVLLAFFTFAVVAVALWGQRIRRWFGQPSLVLTIANTEGEATPITLSWIDPATGQPAQRSEFARLYYARVANSVHRWLPVTEVTIYLLRLDEPGPNGRFQTKWTGSVPLGWRHREIFPAQRTIGPEAEADLCNVIKDKWLELSLLIHPQNLVTRWHTPMRIRITLQARGVEGDSNLLTLEIAWDAKWHDGTSEMAKALTITPVSDDQT